MIRIDREQVFASSIGQGFSRITDIDNWPQYWPGLVRIEADSRWRSPGDRARLILRILRRQIELVMTLQEFVPNRFVAYTSTQAGIPDARHERHFRPAEGGFSYRIVIEYEPRAGLRGLFDRTVLRRSIDGAVRQTMLNLELLLGRS